MCSMSQPSHVLLYKPQLPCSCLTLAALSLLSTPLYMRRSLLTLAGATPTAFTSFSRAAGSLAPVSSNSLKKEARHDSNGAGGKCVSASAGTSTSTQMCIAFVKGCRGLSSPFRSQTVTAVTADVPIAHHCKPHPPPPTLTQHLVCQYTPLAQTPHTATDRARTRTCIHALQCLPPLPPHAPPAPYLHIPEQTNCEELVVCKLAGLVSCCHLCQCCLQLVAVGVWCQAVWPIQLTGLGLKLVCIRLCKEGSWQQ